MKSLFFYFLLLISLFSCTEYTPKPRGYMRLELPSPQYRTVSLPDYPFSFSLSTLALIELPLEGDSSRWMNISYPSLHTKIYCNYLSITPSSFFIAEEESRSLVARQIRQENQIREKEYTHTEKKVFGSLFFLDGKAVTPTQFMLTDSVSHFFRGAVYYSEKVNPDSIAPVTDYIRNDIIELIQSFNWDR